MNFVFDERFVRSKLTKFSLANPSIIIKSKPMKKAHTPIIKVNKKAAIAIHSHVGAKHHACKGN